MLKYLRGLYKLHPIKILMFYVTYKSPFTIVIDADRLPIWWLLQLCTVIIIKLAIFAIVKLLLKKKNGQGLHNHRYSQNLYNKGDCVCVCVCVRACSL